jgi:RHS repeat-associated protein
MMLDQTGSLANVKRHDYLPFGEELFSPTGGRSAALGYASGDGVRQQFTQKERDIEAGLDYFGARYYSFAQGRFTGVDNPGFSNGTDPQTWNLYAYTANNPLRRIDPDGNDWFQIGNGYGARFEWHDGKEYKYKDADGKEQSAKNVGTHLLVFEVTGYNSDDAVVGTLTLYEQNKVVAQNDKAFSGGDPSSLPTGEYNPIPLGVYSITTGDRSVAKKFSDLDNVYDFKRSRTKGLKEHGEPRELASMNGTKTLRFHTAETFYTAERKRATTLRDVFVIEARQCWMLCSR